MARRAKKKKKRGTRRSRAEGSLVAEAPSTPVPDERGDADTPEAPGDTAAESDADGGVALDLDDDLADLDGDLIALVAEATALGEEGEAPRDLAEDPNEPDAEVTLEPSQPPELEAGDAAYGSPEAVAILAAADAADEVEAVIELGETSSPEDRARLLAAALAHAEMQEARYRVPVENRTASRIKGTLALGIFAIAGFLAVAPPAIVRPEPPASVNDLDRRQGVVMTLLLQAEQVEAFRAANDVLPRSLDELSVRLPGVRYVRSSNRLYQLIGYTPMGAAVVYDSSGPSAEFDGAQPVWRDAKGDS